MNLLIQTYQWVRDDLLGGFLGIKNTDRKKKERIVFSLGLEL